MINYISLGLTWGNSKANLLLWKNQIQHVDTDSFASHLLCRKHLFYSIAIALQLCI